MESEDTTSLQRRPRRVVRKQRESSSQQQGKSSFSFLVALVGSQSFFNPSCLFDRNSRAGCPADCRNDVGGENHIFVAQIKSQLLEMPELGDEDMSFGGATPTASRRLTSLRKRSTDA